MGEADIVARIVAYDEGSKVIKDFGDNVSSTGNRVTGALKTAAEGFAIVGAAAIAFGAVSVKAYMDYENVQTQLKSVLQSTHSAAGLTLKDLNDQAEAMQKVTKFSKEQVNTVEALILTFTNIKGAVAQQATPAILDLATAMHEDLQSASIQVGKALNDPVLGITALHRIGVTFSATQKEQIKNFVDTGQTAKAQAVILKELTTEFGGSAVAAGTTFSGSLAKVKNSLHDAQITIGETISKSLEPFAAKAATAIASIDWQKVINNTMNYLKDFGRELDKAWQALDKVYQAVEKYLEPKIDSLGKTIQGMFPTLKTFAETYLIPLAKVFGTVVGEGLVGALGLVIDTANFLLKDILQPLMDFMDAHKGIVYGVATAFGALATSMALGAAFDAIKVAAATFELVTVPSLLATLSAVGAAFIAAVPFAAVLAELAIIVDKVMTTKALLDTLNNQEASDISSGQAAMQQIIDEANSGKITHAKAAEILRGLNQTRASGGSVAAGTPYLVGEQGEEVFVPDQSGKIIPNNKIGSPGASPAGNTIINISVNAGAFTGSQIDARKYAMQVLHALQDYAASKNTTVAKMVGS